MKPVEPVRMIFIVKGGRFEEGRKSELGRLIRLPTPASRQPSGVVGCFIALPPACTLARYGRVDVGPIRIRLVCRTGLQFSQPPKS